LFINNLFKFHGLDFGVTPTKLHIWIINKERVDAIEVSNILKSVKRLFLQIVAGMVSEREPAIIAVGI